ncbi:MAG: hypothetical protein H6717_15220 [Polyangiaceae bacterium]|nr:hypothetical protein [Polyangiaceae bacterium]
MAGVAVAALVIELSGVVMIWPRMRLPFAVAATLLHGGIAMALGYVYFPWVLTVWAVVGRRSEDM